MPEESEYVGMLQSISQNVHFGDPRFLFEYASALDIKFVDLLMVQIALLNAAISYWITKYKVLFGVTSGS